MGIVHQFYIPVMGTGFTIDTPLRVAKYGISSVMALADDDLIEKLRCYHSEKRGTPYEPILKKDVDHRENRITAYLNAIDAWVKADFLELKSSAFEADLEITKYFSLLPQGALKSEYERMLATSNPEEKQVLQEALREQLVLGDIDVNIMTKIDGAAYKRGKELPTEYTMAKSALRGFAQSNLKGSVVLSAGYNPHLYSYMASIDYFLPDEQGNYKKKIILKVSDYRSAKIQGKALAKRGLWVSEFRVESGLNCGGHAFPTQGKVMGPILEEFKQEREALRQELFVHYSKALLKREHSLPKEAPPSRFTVQGGVGTAEEAQFLQEQYSVDAVGWGSPFLLVPEVTHVDEEHLEKLMAATADEIVLSEASPLGAPFWQLTSSESEAQRQSDIDEGRAGSECPKGYLAFNTEFTARPICTASTLYQRKKLEEYEKECEKSELPRGVFNALKESLQAKACLCRGLSGSVETKLEMNNALTTAVCPGPNIINFSRIATLSEMVDHIYGRRSLMTEANQAHRPHLFVKELTLNIDHLIKEHAQCTLELARTKKDATSQAAEHFSNYIVTFDEAFNYYKNQTAPLLKTKERERFLNDLKLAEAELNKIVNSLAI